MSKPLCYLDVDGVLNVGGWAAPQAEYDAAKRPVGGLRGVVVVPPYVPDNIARLADAFEIVWCTAWLGSAHEAWRGILGLPEQSFEYIDYSSLKLPLLLRHAGSRPWVYLDDDAAWEVLTLLGKEPPVSESDLAWPNGRVFPVDGRYGLTDELTDAVLEWAQNPRLTIAQEANTINTMHFIDRTSENAA